MSHGVCLTVARMRLTSSRAAGTVVRSSPPSAIGCSAPFARRCRHAVSGADGPIRHEKGANMVRRMTRVVAISALDRWTTGDDGTGRGGARSRARHGSTTTIRSCWSASRSTVSVSTRRRSRRSPTPTGEPAPPGRPGYEESVDYVVERMTAAGYNVTIDEFPFVFVPAVDAAAADPDHRHLRDRRVHRVRLGDGHGRGRRPSTSTWSRRGPAPAAATARTPIRTRPTRARRSWPIPAARTTSPASRPATSR